MAILTTVAQLRFVSGAQLRRIHITSGTPLGNERVARRTLARLVELGVLDRLERRIGGPGPAGSEGYIYTLAIGGQYVAHTRKLLARSRRRRTLVPGQMFLRHTLAQSELHVRLLEGERQGRWEILERLAEPACWHRFMDCNSEQAILKPDLSVRLRAGGVQRELLIDIDRGTEGTRTLERRLRIYVQFFAHLESNNSEFPTALWLAKSDRRVQVIADAYGRVGDARADLFTAARFELAIETITSLL